jgi:hypothetical protein
MLTCALLKSFNFLCQSHFAGVAPEPGVSWDDY